MEQEKRKNEKDVLVVRDEKTGEISVVAGLDSKGLSEDGSSKGRTLAGLPCASTATATWWITSSGTSTASARSRHASASTGWRRDMADAVLAGHQGFAERTLRQMRKCSRRTRWTLLNTSDRRRKRLPGGQTPETEEAKREKCRDGGCGTAGYGGDEKKRILTKNSVQQKNRGDNGRTETRTGRTAVPRGAETPTGNRYRNRHRSNSNRSRRSRT